MLNLKRELTTLTVQVVLIPWGVFTLEKLTSCTRVPLVCFCSGMIQISLLVYMSRFVGSLVGGPILQKGLIISGKPLFWAVPEMMVQLKTMLGNCYLVSIGYVWWTNCGEEFNWVDKIFMVFSVLLAVVLAIWGILFIPFNRKWTDRVRTWRRGRKIEATINQFVEEHFSGPTKHLSSWEYRVLVDKIGYAEIARLSSIDFYQLERLEVFSWNSTINVCQMCKDQMEFGERTLKLACCQEIVHWDCVRGRLTSFTGNCPSCQSPRWQKCLRDKNLQLN